MAELAINTGRRSADMGEAKPSTQAQALEAECTPNPKTPQSCASKDYVGVHGWPLPLLAGVFAEIAAAGPLWIQGGVSDLALRA